MGSKKMAWKVKNRQKGFTLIESIISVALISIITIITSSLFSFAFNSYKRYTDTRQIKYDVYIASKYIEKGLKEFNQEDVIFDSDKNIFQSKNCNNENVWVDLSGKKSLKKNTLIYFYRVTKEIRVNKNNEHNVLCGNIDDVAVNELIEGRLIEIEVIADKIEYSNKIKLNLNYRKN
ncbi:MAG: prepilin-type N-terminal cleavage/methylation domain-containing protein [Natronincolaceae bacterium]|jgi:prepilin-type N-terminal cleavage/methylation domain-containing protein